MPSFPLLLVLTWISSHPMPIYQTIYKLAFPLEKETYNFGNVLHVLSRITCIARGFKDNKFKHMLIHRWGIYYTQKSLEWKIIY